MYLEDFNPTPAYAKIKFNKLFSNVKIKTK